MSTSGSGLKGRTKGRTNIIFPRLSHECYKTDDEGQGCVDWTMHLMSYPSLLCGS